MQLGPAFDSMSALPGALESAPPSPANNRSSLQLRLREIGLQPLREEGQVVHIHQHLGHDVPGHDAVPRHDAAADVRVGGDERVDLRGIVDEEHEQAAGRRRAERAGHDEPPVLLPLAHEREVVGAQRARFSTTSST